MAGGIDWFRWHHGSVTDPKFQLIAKKARVRLPDVLAVWAFLLEQASAADDRGEFGSVDTESLELLFDLEEGQCQAILNAMEARELTSSKRIVAWERRQPKREREDATAAERKARQRARETQPVGVMEDVTPCHAMSHHVTPREEESREEVNLSSADAEEAIGDAESRQTEQLPDCPHQVLIDLYAKHLSQLPYPRVWEGRRAQSMRARWRWVLTAKKQDGRRYATDEASAVAWFERFFGYVARSDFLTGRNGKWESCDLGWLMKAENFAKVIQGNYDNREAA